MQKVILIFFVVTHSIIVFSQEINDSLHFNSFYQQLVSRTDKPNFGNVTIVQDSNIIRLIEKHITINKADINLTGWRIQIYNSSGKEARDDASEVRNKFMNSYFNVKAYLIYQPPFFKIRVGDFRTKQDAFTLYKLLLKEYPLSYLVQDKINLPPIQ